MSVEEEFEDQPSKHHHSHHHHQHHEDHLQAKQSSAISLDDISEVELALLTMRKPTELKRVIDQIPRPTRAVPKNGLPVWYRMGLECKLPVPEMPKGKIVFSRGKIGEDIRRDADRAGQDCRRPAFDLTDPYCYNISYDYEEIHDPFLAFHFSQKPCRKRMTELGFCTKDGRAVCSLKQFNQYRKYLYIRFMDRIRVEMQKMDEHARDTLTLKLVKQDVAKRQLAFNKAEKCREMMAKHVQMFADEEAERKRKAKEQEKKIKARMKYLAEFNAKQHRERCEKALEKENRIKQRVHAAEELELRRKISMVRQWRLNEQRRKERMNAENAMKKKIKFENMEKKWAERIAAQNQKIQEQQLLLNLYTEDLNAGSARRSKKAEVTAYTNELKLQVIRLENWKLMHGKEKKAQQLIKKMGVEFEKSKRGAKGMNREVAHEMAKEAMTTAQSTAGDALMMLAQARARMDVAATLPVAPIKLLDQVLESAIMEFVRRRTQLLLKDVERAVRQRAEIVFFKKARPSEASRRSRPPRWSVQLTAAVAQQYASVRGPSIAIGEVQYVSPDNTVEILTELKSVKTRIPTPVPSLTKLAEVTFTDRIEDLPDPVPSCLPERAKLLQVVNNAAKVLSNNVSHGVQKGMDLTLLKITLPRVRHPMEYGEAVEALANAVLNNRISKEAPDIRHVTLFLTSRILCHLQEQTREEKARRKSSARSITPQPVFEELIKDTKDFYVPGKVQDTNDANDTPKDIPEKDSSFGKTKFDLAASHK